MAAICPKCQKALPEAAQFCRRCGAALQPRSADTTLAAPSASLLRNNIASSRSLSSVLTNMTILAIIIAFGAALGLSATFSREGRTFWGVVLGCSIFAAFLCALGWVSTIRRVGRYRIQLERLNHR